MSWSVIAEVAYGVPPADEPDPGDWVDVSSALQMPVTTVVGMGGGGGWEGRANFDLADPDRLFDPTGTGGSKLDLMLHCRLTVDTGAETLPWYRGYIHACPPAWQFGYAGVNVTLQDAMAWLGTQDGDVDLAAQESHDRVTAILDAASWPAGRRDIGDGVVRLEAYEQEGANLRRVLEDTADAEDGQLYVDPSGDIVYRSRHSRFDAVSQATLANDGTGLDLAEGLRPRWDTAPLISVGRVELANGDAFEAVDAGSVGAFGPRPAPVRDLSLTAVESTALAEWIVLRYGDSNLWLDQVSVLCEPGDTLGLVHGDLVTVTYVTAAGSTFEAEMHVERIQHRAEPGRWLTTFDLSPYFGEGPWMVLDDAVLGRLDEDNKLAP